MDRRKRSDSFLCTRIKYVRESEIIYNQFKKDFKVFDYVIASIQPIPVNDEKDTGYLERDELNELYNTCKVMFYQSIDPRHLHYHPLEAMIAGMPVVYMEGSLLSILAEGTSKSGSCNTIGEARKKVKQSLSNDQSLIKSILTD